MQMSESKMSIYWNPTMCQKSITLPGFTLARALWSGTAPTSKPQKLSQEVPWVPSQGRFRVWSFFMVGDSVIQNHKCQSGHEKKRKWKLTDLKANSTETKKIQQNYTFSRINCPVTFVIFLPYIFVIFIFLSLPCVGFSTDWIEISLLLFFQHSWSMCSETHWEFRKISLFSLSS